MKAQWIMASTISSSDSSYKQFQYRDTWNTNSQYQSLNYYTINAVSTPLAVIFSKPEQFPVIKVSSKHQSIDGIRLQKATQYVLHITTFLPIVQGFK